jgi:hypothetical protein
MIRNEKRSNHEKTKKKILTTEETVSATYFHTKRSEVDILGGIDSSQHPYLRNA